MKQDNINYFMVGTLVLTTFFVFIVVILLMTGKTGNTEKYSVNYSNISGVQAGSAVTYGGFQIGQVDSVAPVSVGGSTQFKLHLAIDSDWQIPKDSEARIYSPGLLSDPLIDIVEGTSRDILQPGGQLKGREAADLFGAINTVVYEVKDLSEKSIKPLLENIGHRIDGVSEHINEAGGDLTEGIPLIIDNVNTLLVNMNASATRLKNILGAENTSHVNSVLGNADITSQNLVQLSAGLDETVTHLDGLIASTGEHVNKNSEDVNTSIHELRKSIAIINKNVDAIVYNINVASRNFNEFSHQIRINPGLLMGTEPITDNSEVRK